MDEPKPLPLLKALIPKVPLIGKTALSHALGYSEQSKLWDLRTALTVNILRSFILDSATTTPMSKAQYMSTKAPEVKGRIWISKATIAKPEEDDIRQALFTAIEKMKEPDEASGGFTEPELLPVTAEWTGYRADVPKNAPELDISEEEKYQKMMKEVTTPTTVLYFHGGSYYLLDPSRYRPTAKTLAKLTKGRVFNVRYRLAPQNPFPAALIDALVSYLSLLYPLPGAFHAPVEAQHIVVAGDSAGGNLSAVLLQSLLEFKREGRKITWNGEERDVPLPAGIVLCSPWADVTSSMPSCSANGPWDYLPAMGEDIPQVEVVKDEIWPTNPPRKNVYAEDAVCILAPSEVMIKKTFISRSCSLLNSRYLA
jgi:acetyl esterase/lipase